MARIDNVVVVVGVLALLTGRGETFPADVSTITSAASDAVQTKTQAAQSLASNFLSVLGKGSGSADSEAAAIPFTKKMYDFVESVLMQVLKPKPILDETREEDKYGNDGEKFNKVGRSVVGGVESLTTFIASAADFPVNTLKSFTRQATAALNKLGSKIVGLSR